MLQEMRPLLPLCLFAMVLQARQAPPRFDPDTLLQQVRKKMNLALDRLPRYMCTETIDRFVSRPATTDPDSSCENAEHQRSKKGWRAKPRTSDRLRLDVAVSEHSEMYSWAGDHHFEDRSLADLVRSGATSTGAFSSFLSAVFQSEAAIFAYKGETSGQGRPLAEFEFRVPLEKSKYSVGDKLNHAIVPYHGVFLIDPATVDLVRLTVHADRIPAKISACSISNTLDYESIRLNHSEFVLPVEVRFQVVRSDGSELENRTVFSGCHQFLGESSLRFDEPAAIKKVASSDNEWKSAAVPRDRPFTVTLTEAIRTATAAAGDPVIATLRTAIKGRDRRVIVPAGALVRGRIIQMQRTYGQDDDSLLLAIRLDSVEVSGAALPFHARLDSAITGRPRAMRGESATQRLDDSLFEDTINPAATDAGILRFESVGAAYVVARGTQLMGTTLASP